MSSVSYPIMGHYYHPPAKAIVSFLPVGHPLILLPEPTNHVDPNAVAIWVDSATLPEEGGDDWESALAGFGLTWPELKAEPFWHLGYLPAAVAAKYALDGTLPLDSEGRVEATFTVGVQGGPRVRWEV